MALYGSFSTVRAQAPQTPGFLTAFAYVADLLRDGSEVAARLQAMVAGESRRVELGHGVFVMEQVYLTKPRSAGFFESHQQYIDVQVLLEGTELMELADLSRMKVRDPYQAERDLVVHDDNSSVSTLRVVPGEAAIFYPADVHMPSLRLGAEPVLVRKAVVKVPVH
jgi:YhcH/YjgK/YiaL family protein